MRTPLLRILIILGMLCFVPLSSAWARHKCPKIPAPSGFFGLFTTTTLLPTGSTMATARASQTSGCGRGHPSSDFYKPSIGRMEIYLEDTLVQVDEESAQGQGTHLAALALLAGCPAETTPIFSETLQSHYSSIFQKADAENSANRSFFRSTAERIFILKRTQPELASSCEQG